MKIVLTADEFFSMLQTGKSSDEGCLVMVEHDGIESYVGTYVEVSALMALNAKSKLKAEKKEASSIEKVEKQYKRRRKKHASPNRDTYNRGRNKLPFKHYSEEEKMKLDKFFKTRSNHYSNGSLMISAVNRIAKELDKTPAAVLVYFSTHGYRTHRYKGTIQIPTGGKKR